MCKECVVKIFPDRGSAVHENSEYVINYKGCPQCGERCDLSKIDRKTDEDEDGEETITFTHTCKACGHKIGQHFYSFKVEDGYQEYLMECILCGRGVDSISVTPSDPRLTNMLF